jgi:hypothetical protein
LAANTRKGYSSAIKSWEAFLALNGLLPYPAKKMDLGEWIAQRAFGTAAPLMGRVKPETLSNYVSAIRSRHIDLGHSIAAFEDHTIKRALAGAMSLFPSTKKTKLPITKDILDKIITLGPCKADANVDAAFTMAFAGFLRIGEITYPNRKAKDFSTTKALRSDVRIAPDSHSMVFHLKRSKTDKTHSGVDIQIAAIPGDRLYPVAAIIRLFNRDPRPLLDLLFSVNNRAFSAPVVRKILSTRLAAGGILPNGYSNHSFRRGVAQHAHNCGFAESQTAQLGRWTSDAVKLYYNTSETERLQLNSNFQRSVPILAM